MIGCHWRYLGSDRQPKCHGCFEHQLREQHHSPLQMHCTLSTQSLKVRTVLWPLDESMVWKDMKHIETWWNIHLKSEAMVYLSGPWDGWREALGPALSAVVTTTSHLAAYLSDPQQHRHCPSSAVTSTFALDFQDIVKTFCGHFKKNSSDDSGHWSRGWVKFGWVCSLVGWFFCCKGHTRLWYYNQLS